MKIEQLNSDQHLSYEELVEYSQGNLSNSEMHRLEQHLIGCELCNEALEGITLLGREDGRSSLERIKQATGGVETKGFGLYHYIGLAASIILIAVLGFVFLRDGKEEPELMAERATDALDKGTTEMSQAVPEQIAIGDSTEEAANDTEYLAMNEATEEEELTEPATIPPVPIKTEADTQTVVGTQPVVIDSGADMSADVVIADLDITDDDSTALSNMDSTLIAVSEIPDEEEQAAFAARSRTAEPTEVTMAEKKTAAVTEVLPGEYVSAEPDRGMRAFERYLKRNLEYPEAASDAAIEGDVVLSVAVKADGSLGEIVVKTSLGYGCDEEAIRLVREGPAWTAATRGGVQVADQVSVTVSFKR